MTSPTIIWNEGDRNGTFRAGWLDAANNDINGAIDKLEAAAGTRGAWDSGDHVMWDWDGLVGTFGGKVFTVYTHKSGAIKIGSHGDGLDVAGLVSALDAIIGKESK